MKIVTIPFPNISQRDFPEEELRNLIADYNQLRDSMFTIAREAIENP